MLKFLFRFSLFLLLLFFSTQSKAQSNDYTFSDRIVIYDSLGNNYSNETYFLADANNDKLEDIILLKDNWVLYILENQGDGEFSSPDSFTTVYNGTTGMMLTDLDQDGDKDLLYKGSIDKQFRAYFRENSNGTFKKSIEITAPDTSRKGIYFSDIDNNNKIDIISYYQHDGAENDQLKIINFKKELEFSSEELLIDKLVDFDYLRLLDIDNDGYKDILVKRDDKNENYYNSKIAIYFNNGDKFISDFRNAVTVHRWSLDYVLADLNSDGINDFITGNWEGPISLHLSNGDSTYTESSIYSDYTTSWRYYGSKNLADIDNDGLEDLIFTSGDTDGVNSNISWLKRTGATDFGKPYLISRNFPTGELSRDVFRRVFDIDNDGRKDILGTAYYDYTKNDINNERYAIFWYRNELEGPVVSNENQGNQKINTITLHNNYPNPFNPTTTIEYQVTYPMEVKLEVFNNVGQKVSTLVNNQLKQSGQYKVTFDATNLSSGIYYYVLTTNDLTKTKMMTLIK